MDAAARTFIQNDILTLAEIADLYGISVFAARKRAERGGWEYVLKSGTRLYHRNDLPDLPQEKPPHKSV